MSSHAGRWNAPAVLLVLAGLLLIAAVSLAITLWLEPSPAACGWLFLAVVIPVTLRWGLGSGLLTAVAASILLSIVANDPLGVPLTEDPSDRFRLAVAVIGLFATAVFIDRVNRARLVAERTLAAEAIRREADRVRQRGDADLRTVLDSLPIGVWFTDEHGSVLLDNPAGAEIWGRRVSGRDHAGVHRGWWTDSGEPVTAAEWSLGRALRGESVVGEVIDIETFDAKLKTILSSAVPVRDETGAIRGAVVINEDITARRTIEAERERLLVSEQAARSAAETALLVRDRVIAAVSHDLKSPLTVLLGIAQLLRRELSRAGGPDLSRVGDALTRIESSARSMTAMMDELIDAARLEIGQSLSLNREPVDLVALVRRVLDRYQGASDRHHLSLESEEASIIGDWDVARLERVLDNLVTNAIKYSPNGGPVSVALRSDDGEAVLSVRDRGIGILTDDLAQIFEPFRRGTNVPERISGTGIGLAGVRQIVAQHGGRVGVESSEDAGSTFTIHLPLVAPPDAADEADTVLIAGDAAVTP